MLYIILSTIPSCTWSGVQAAPGFGVQDLVWMDRGRVGSAQLGMVLLLYTGVPALHNHVSQ